MSDRARDAWPAWPPWRLVIVCLAGVFSYVNAFRGDFVFDDIKLIVNNDLIKSATHIPEILFSNLWDLLGRGSNYYRPLPPLLFMALHAIFGLRPEPFHVVNIALHAGATGLVFLLARELASSGRVRPISRPEWPALAAALLFAAHPIHSEAVAWISGVMDVSCTFFSLLAIWTYVRADGGELRRLLYAVSLVALLLALFSKEPAIAVPALLVVYDVLFRRERIGSVRAIARRWGPPFGVLAAYLVLRVVALEGLAPFRTAASAGLSRTLVNVPVLFSLYAEKLIVPVGLNVVHDLRPAGSFGSPEALAALGVLALCVLAAILWARTGRQACFALLVFVLPLTPALYVPALAQDLSKAFAERYAYFPSAGLALVVATALAWLGERHGRWYGPALAAALGVTVLFSGMTLARNAVWKDSYALWSDSVRKSPGLALAHESLGLALLRRGQAEEAKRELQAALRLDPSLPQESLASGVLAARRGQLLQAMLAFETALAYRPDLVEAHYNLGVAFESRGWIGPAVQEYRVALGLKGDHGDAHNNLAVLLAQEGRLDEAIAHFEAAIQARPEDAQVRANLARAYGLKAREKAASTPSR